MKSPGLPQTQWKQQAVRSYLLSRSSFRAGDVKETRAYVTRSLLTRYTELTKGFLSGVTKTVGDTVGGVANTAGGAGECSFPPSLCQNSLSTTWLTRSPRQVSGLTDTAGGAGEFIIPSHCFSFFLPRAHSPSTHINTRSLLLVKGLGDTVGGATKGLGNTVNDTTNSAADSIGGKEQTAQNPLGLNE